VTLLAILIVDPSMVLALEEATIVAVAVGVVAEAASDPFRC
jgi:hypothetical protein